MLAGRRVLLGVTGGIAAYKAAILARLLTGSGADVTAVLTESATRFVGTDTFSALTGRDAFSSLWERPGEVLHVRLAHETDVVVIAPATANALAKFANGLADDLLSATVLEYEGPLVIAPAMHSGMWTSEATQHNVQTLVSRGARVVGPVEGALAHGDEGIGRLSEPADIFEAVVAAVHPPDLAGRVVVVTAGPTHEPLDPVRFLGNRSSGKMGVAVAAEAAARGAAVTLILGPGTVPPPPRVEVIRVETAESMRSAVVAAATSADAVVMAAAVADFRPKEAAQEKLKKDAGLPELILEPTPDILSELGDRKGSLVLVGFAAETDDTDLSAAGREKLQRKHLDLLVANAVGREGTGFGADTNDAAIVAADGNDVARRTWTKPELARAVCDRVAALLARP